MSVINSPTLELVKELVARCENSSNVRNMVVMMIYSENGNHCLGSENKPSSWLLDMVNAAREMSL